MPGASPLSSQGFPGIKDVLTSQLRTRVYSSICDRRGITIRQIAEMISEPPRRVRHQVELLVGAGLVEIDTEAPTQGVRGRPYRARFKPVIYEEDEGDLTDAERRSVAASVLGCVVADINESVDSRTFGKRAGYGVVRVPGEVDLRGWNELAELMVSTTSEVEAAISASAERLRSPEDGIESVCALFLFEKPAWEASAGEPPPRALSWLRSERFDEPAGRPSFTADHRDAMLAAMTNQLRTRVYTTVFDRPGITIKEIAEWISEPPRRVRHQIELLVGSGLVEIDSESLRRKTRERQYRVRVKPVILEGEGEDHLTDEERRLVGISVLRLIISDFGAAIAKRTFGKHAGHAEVRIPGELDQQGWDEVAEVVVRAMSDAENAMTKSAERLYATESRGIDTLCALVFFEMAPGESAEREPLPRITSW